MERSVYFYFFDFEEHVDFTCFNEKSIAIEKIIKGSPTPNGKRQYPYNVLMIKHAGPNLPDDYDMRIETLFMEVGGEEIVKELIEKYQARYVDIVLGIPSKTSEMPEGGAISCATMKKICNLEMGLQFYYT